MSSSLYPGGGYPASGLQIAYTIITNDLVIVYDIEGHIAGHIVVPPNEQIFGPNSYEFILPAVWSDEELGWPARDFLYAAGEMFDEIENIVRDSDFGIGWSVVVDVNRCPDKGLDWLAQFLGIVLPSGLTEDQRRERIKSTDGFQRGTVKAIKGAALPWLINNKTVIVRERETSAYNFRVLTYVSETPQADWPIGNVLTNANFEVSLSGWSTNPV